MARLGRFQNRVTRYAPEAAAVLAVVLGLIAVRLRRLELASALHARIPRSALTLQLLVETAVWTSAAALISIPTVLAAVHALRPTDVMSLVACGAGALAPLPAAILGSLIGSALVRENNLFAYFRDR